MLHLSHLVGKPTMWFLNRSDTNRPVQAQKQARSLKFWSRVEEELYYRVAKTKALISFAVTAKLICSFGFAYADCWFSHGEAHLLHCTCSTCCNMSLCMRKPTICICENKGADQLRGNREADQRLCFRYTDSTLPLLLKSKISSF